MNYTETDWMLHKAHHEELIQISAVERLARQASPAQSSRKAQGNNIVEGLITLFLHLEYRLPASGY